MGVLMEQTFSDGAFFELTEKGHRYVDIQLEISRLAHEALATSPSSIQMTQLRAQIFNLEEDAARLLNEP